MTSRIDGLAILRLMRVSGLGPKTLHRLLIRAASCGITPAELIRMQPSVLQRQFGLNEAIASEIPRESPATEAVKDELDARGVILLSVLDAKYPAQLLGRLGEDAPAVLFATGSLELLGAHSVACAGSRSASDRGLVLARMACRELANNGVNVVSGHANGVDLAAHEGAVAAGGTTTVVTAEGILAFRPKSALAECMTEHNSLIISQFWPTGRWTKYQAMQRNRTIIGLSRAMLIVESGSDGGTFDAGTAAIRIGLPVFAFSFVDPPKSAEGNQLLIKRGAVPLSPDAKGGIVSPILDAQLRDQCRPPMRKSLFD